MLTTRFILSLVVLTQPILCLPYISPRQASNNFTRLIVFGDSYSDDGNGAWIVSNETWPSDPAYYGHHFSNGPVWAQDLSEALGFELLDYAVGGATSNNTIVQGYTGYNSTIPVPSTADQIQTFLSNTTIHSNQDILTIYIGFNDIFFDPSLTASTISSQINSQIQTLHTHGARNILLATYPNPATMPGEDTANTTAKASLTAYNTGLTHDLYKIATAWSNRINIGVADVGALFTRVQADPERYGVEAGYVRVPQACLTGTYPDSGPRVECTNPMEHLFWDLWHPTGRIHRMMAVVFAEVLGGFL